MRSRPRWGRRGRSLLSSTPVSAWAADSADETGVPWGNPKPRGACSPGPGDTASLAALITRRAAVLSETRDPSRARGVAGSGSAAEYTETKPR